MANNGKKVQGHANLTSSSPPNDVNENPTHGGVSNMTILILASILTIENTSLKDGSVSFPRIYTVT